MTVVKTQLTETEAVIVMSRVLIDCEVFKILLQAICLKWKAAFSVNNFKKCLIILYMNLKLVRFGSESVNFISIYYFDYRLRSGDKIVTEMVPL